MRRDVDRGASLRTDPSIYALYGIICAQRHQSCNVSAHRLLIRDAVSDGLWNRFFADAQNDNGRALGMTVAQEDREDALYQIPRCRSE